VKGLPVEIPQELLVGPLNRIEPVILRFDGIEGFGQFVRKLDSFGPATVFKPIPYPSDFKIVVLLKNAVGPSIGIRRIKSPNRDSRGSSVLDMTVSS
jgi:hypothetical protein